MSNRKPLRLPRILPHLVYYEALAPAINSRLIFPSLAATDGQDKRDQRRQRSKRDPDQRKEQENWNGRRGLCCC